MNKGPNYPRTRSAAPQTPCDLANTLQHSLFDTVLPPLPERSPA